jgi:hypothetical protein
MSYLPLQRLHIFEPSPVYNLQWCPFRQRHKTDPNP